MVTPVHNGRYRLKRIPLALPQLHHFSSWRDSCGDGDNRPYALTFGPKVLYWDAITMTAYTSSLTAHRSHKKLLAG